MKKSLLALAALTAFAGAASAQSSVTLFGIVDAGVARLSAGGTSVIGMTNSGYNSSRLGFRGVEDLGGGLKAGFWIEGQLMNDDGNAAGMNWQRRSTVSLMGGFGEIRLGRDYTPEFWNQTIYDPFGTNGIGSSSSIAMLAGNANVTTAVRSNNSISYFTPNLGGFSAQVMYAFGEKVKGTPNEKENNYLGARVGYAAGPFAVHAAYGKTEGATDALDHKVWNVAGSWNAGFLTAMLNVQEERNGAGLKVQLIQPGITVPVGPGVIRASYGHYNQKGGSAAWNDNDYNKVAVGYLHNLSKRTVLYATYARVSNDGTQTKTVANNGLSGVMASPGGSSSGVEFGIRHAF